MDGPGLGLSDPLLRRSSITEAAEAALDLLAGLGMTGPVDWVGNDFGGHVGYKLAAIPGVLRSLVAISAPVEPISAALRANINVLLPSCAWRGPWVRCDTPLSTRCSRMPPHRTMTSAVWL